MTLSTIYPLLLATPFAASLLELTVELLPLIAQMGRRIVAFRQGAVTPAASHAFERDLQELLRKIGRVIVQWVYNHLETSDLSQAPDLIRFDHNVYRRRSQQLTALLKDVLLGWPGLLPRLQYVTDGGHHLVKPAVERSS